MLRETLLWRRIQTRDPKSCRYIGLVIFFKVYPLVKGRDDRKLLVLDDILQASSTADTIGVGVDVAAGTAGAKACASALKRDTASIATMRSVSAKGVEH